MLDSNGRNADHPWPFNFKLKGGPSYRFSLDTQSDKPIRAKTKAEELADSIRTAIRAGTFRRRNEQTAATPVPADVITFESFGNTYFERLGRPETVNGRSCFGQLCVFALNGAPFGQKALTLITEDDIEEFFKSLRPAGERSERRT